ncbi:MAG TPA: carboxypeptidase regulatory-like domain-containing protein [Acidobacteriaceae bacterium]|nr:carboxypeptidase regulatory-like domain-containing protein [Acidobacteriaceae bacterium]
MALAVSLAAAATISGTVIDKTTGKPAAGDTAVLLDLQQGMTESAHTTIDAKGHYSFTVPDTNGMHLVRVDHEKASYYGPVPPNTTSVNIDVFDVAPKVDGIHVYADVERMETDQQGLSVTESYFVRNESKPPKTQLSAHSFEIYLPTDATLEGATAAGPGGMAVASSPVPTGEKGHYAFIFPLRPGETRFQIGYHLPYSGSATLHAQVSLPADNVAVMLPKSMTFSGQGFQPLQGDASGPGTQTFLAANVKANTPVAFTVSGTGSMPREQQQAQNPGGPAQGMGAPDQSGAGPEASQSAAPSNAPGGGLGNPIDTPDPLQKYKWWILSGVGLALVIAAAFMLRGKPGQQPAVAGGAPAPNPLTPSLPPGVKATAVRAGLVSPPATNGAPFKQVTASGTLAALKEELFALETERLEGKITEAEYAEHKAALEVLLKRALAREAAAK